MGFALMWFAALVVVLAFWIWSVTEALYKAVLPAALRARERLVLARQPAPLLELPAPAEELQHGEYRLPPTTLLCPVPPEQAGADPEALHAMASRLAETLAAYNVRGQIDAVKEGPVVTMFEFAPDVGVKISQVADRSDELAMGLGVESVRVVTRIRGKARIGLEIPTAQRQTVYLRELLEAPEWRDLDMALPIALGKDASGSPMFQDLAVMPHLLVAGATGAGKSVGLNVMLVSLLMRKTPAQLRLLLVDPKVVELAVFDGIPHLLLPVVTDMKDAAKALQWAVDEMERRYQMLARAKVRNIAGYNAQCDEDEQVPHIVVVVDEFADLMMVAAKEVEAAIARLAQKARAAGIHVIVATQRPSVDVITGMIKANFPCRIAFQTAQREDSKTIIGTTGAEDLLGLGDMLCKMPGSNELQRAHSAYLSNEEVEAVCSFLRGEAEPDYNTAILEAVEDDESDLRFEDPQYERAVRSVVREGFCTVERVQEVLKIDAKRAAKIVKQLERAGVVGPDTGSPDVGREVLIGTR